MFIHKRGNKIKCLTLFSGMAAGGFTSYVPFPVLLTGRGSLGSGTYLDVFKVVVLSVKRSVLLGRACLCELMVWCLRARRLGGGENGIKILFKVDLTHGNQLLKS